MNYEVRRIKKQKQKYSKVNARRMMKLTLKKKKLLHEHYLNGNYEY